MFLAVVGVFAVCLAVILGLYWMLVVRPEGLQERDLRKRLKGRRNSPLAAAVAKPQEQLSALAPLDALLVRSDSLVAPLRNLVSRSGLPVTIGALLLGCVFLASVTALLITYLSSSLLLGIAMGAVVCPVPVLFVRHKANQRLALFEEQFPEAIDLMARALRAGHALTTALQMVGDEIPEPIGSEFRRLFEQQNYGMSLTDALREFALRLPILDARFFVTAILTQRETGGNLSEVLDNLAAVIRERFKVKRQVRVMSAHGRITGWVLGLLPPVVAMVLFTISPSQMRVLVDDPLGVYMVVAAMILQVIGVLAIRKIVDVEY